MIVGTKHDRSTLVRSKPSARFRRTVTRRVGHPSVDLSFAPASAVNADWYLRRERPFGDLAVDGRSRQSCAVKNGSKPDDPV